MLRLRVAAALPWVDSRNIIRSPLEQFTILENEARRALIAEPRSFVTWEFGALTDSWERPESSKPLLIGAEDEGDSSITSYAIGSQLAPEYQKELRPLWVAFLNWMNDRQATNVYYLADEFWTEDQGWLEIGEALQRRLVPGVTALTHTRAPGVYSAREQQISLGTLLSTWWPSGLGMFGGSSVKEDGDHEFESLLSRGRIATADLANLDRCFQTAGSFDNLGLIVLSRDEHWAELRDALAQRGWVDGLPIEVALAQL